MNCVSTKDLQNVVDRINRTTGSPLASYVEGADGKYKPQGGNYHLDSNVGGISLERMMPTGSGVVVVLNRGTKADLYARMHAWLSGYEAGQKTAKA